MKKIIFLTITILLLISLSSCKDNKVNYKSIEGLDTNEKVTLKIAKYSPADPALDFICNKFMTRYPNVAIEQKYYENYDKVAADIIKNKQADIAFYRGLSYRTEEITDEVTQTTKTMTSDDYYIDFLNCPEVDLSTITDKVTGNYTYTRPDESKCLYSVPLGGELRGVYVNTSLLKLWNLEVPKTWTQFLECCQKIKELGYVACQGNPSTAPTNAFMADAVNSVVHDSSRLQQFELGPTGVSQYFKETFEKVYNLALNRYYDYKYIEEEYSMFKESDIFGQAKSFLGLKRDENTLLYSTPANNIGYAAFFAHLSFLGSTLDYLIDEYNLDTTYEFIMLPTADDSNGSCYMTPYYGIVGSKQSDYIDWVKEFVNFIMFSDHNIEFAEREGIIANSNTKDVNTRMAEKYHVDENKSCASCGEILFKKFNGYTSISNTLVNISKCNCQKYMIKLEKNPDKTIKWNLDVNNNKYLLTDNGKSSLIIYEQYVGNEDEAKPGYAFIKLEYYINEFEKALAKARTAN